MTEFPYPTLDIEPGKIIALTESLIDVPVTYGLGAKADPLSLQAGEFHQIDCSGFVRWAIWHATAATGSALEIPDGSYNQHAWADAQHFKASTVDDADLQDGAVRIAFLSPADGGGIGHVMLIINGSTCESHGGKGVDRRAWGSEGFMAECDVYVLTAPVEAD